MRLRVNYCSKAINVWITTSTPRIIVCKSLRVARVCTEIFRLLRNTKTLYCPHVSSSLGPVQSQINPCHTLLPYLYKIRLTLYSNHMWEDNIKVHLCAIGWCLSKRQCEGSSDVIGKPVGQIQSLPKRPCAVEVVTIFAYDASTANLCLKVCFRTNFFAS